MIEEIPRGKSSSKIKYLTKERSKGTIHSLPNVINQSQQVLSNKITLQSLQNIRTKTTTQPAPSRSSSKRTTAANNQIKGMMYI